LFFICFARQDKAKLERQRQKEVAAQRAAFEAHQKLAKAAVAGAKPVIIRNT
jgi:hypothetical protein